MSEGGGKKKMGGLASLKKAGSQVVSGVKLQNAAKTAHGSLLAVIGDEDTVTGMLLAGIGNVDARRTSNFLVVDSKTTPGQIEEAFIRFTKRSDVAVLLINQYIASMIRSTVDGFEAKSPAILEIPSKEHPYDPEQDVIHRRTKLLLGIRD